MKPEYSKELLAEMWKKLNLAREFETRVQWLFSMGLVHGTTHLGIGEEATAVGSILALKPQDYVFGTHRGHSQAIAKGIDIDHMMAEILAKETGVCKGKGGSMHIMAMDLGILGANGIVGGGIPMATGAGYSSKYRGTDQVTLCFFGDGAANEGTFHESINMAAAWDLPVVYVIENNLYGITVDSRRVTKEHDLAKRAIGYGIPGYTIDGNDVETVYKTMQKAVKHAREGKGPSIVECKTYRHHGHNGSDPGTYRPPEEVEAWKARDPLILFRDKGYLTEKERKEIEDKVEQEVQAACKFAAESPYPEASELMDDIFCD